MENGKTVKLDNIVRLIEYDQECIPKPQLQLTEDNRRYCAHEHINIYKYHRKLYCRDCGATLDAFNWIAEMGRQESNQLSTLRWLNIEVKRRQEEIKKLEK